MKKTEIIKILKLLKDNIEIIQKKLTTDNINKNKVNFCISKLDIIQENLNKIINLKIEKFNNYISNNYEEYKNNIFNNLNKFDNLINIILNTIDTKDIDHFKGHISSIQIYINTLRVLFLGILQKQRKIKEELNSININQVKNNDSQKYHVLKKLDDIKEFNQNYDLKVSLLNIDSRFRNKIPKNIIDSKVNYLDNNSIIVQKNLNILKIKLDTTNFEIGNNITLQNVTGKFKNLIKPIYLINNFNYMIINFDNHNIPSDFLNFIDNIKINITDINNSDFKIIDNIPYQSLLGVKKIIHFNSSNINIDENILQLIKTLLNITDDNNLYNNYILVEIPYKFNCSTGDFNNIDSNFKIEFLNIGGIPLYYINSNYPINSYQYQSKLEIIDKDDNYLYIKLSINGIFDETNGGSKVNLGKIIETLDGYPEANSYSINLKKVFTNVVRIELVTTEIPFIDFIIKNNVTNKNNKLYWQNFEDGNTIYEVEIPEGNYEPNTLISTLQTEMNLVERYDSTPTTRNYNIFEIILNQNSNQVTFKSFKFKNLPFSLFAEKDTINNEVYIKITINHPSSFVEVNDEITIRNANSLGDISSTFINTTHIVYSVNNIEGTYCIILRDIDTNLSDISGNGGSNISIRSRAKSKFLFNYNDTIGSILGFKNVGNPNAITEFNHKTTNFDNYIFPSLFNEVGSDDITNNMINLTGLNTYLLMYINDFESIISNSTSDNAFSKIILNGVPGDYMFNTFVNSPLEFDFPISSLNELFIRFEYPDGTSPDFRNFDHSFTLRLTELIYKPKMSNLDSKDSNYLNTLVNKTFIDGLNQDNNISNV